MLVLGRKEGESILIEGGIRIVVVACDKGGVRLGIEAPSALRILRGELAEQVAQENQRASLPADAAWLHALVSDPRGTNSLVSETPVSDPRVGPRGASVA